MPLTQKEIEAVEDKWGVEIDKLPNGSYRITTLETPDTTGDHRSYQIDVRPIKGMEIDPVYAEKIGVELTGNKALDMENINRTNWENTEGHEDFHDNYPDFDGSHLQRGASVAGWLRSDGEFPPESFEANPAFGAAGAGAEINFGGGPGGYASTIGVQHDVDFTIGLATGKGPLGVTNDFLHHTGELPPSSIGISNVVDLARGKDTLVDYDFTGWLGEKTNVPAAYDEAHQKYPPLSKAPDYDLKVREAMGKVTPEQSNVPGWDVEIDNPAPSDFKRGGGKLGAHTEDSQAFSIDESLALAETVKSDPSINPALKKVLDHDSSREMFENLKANGVNSLDVTMPEGASPETQITEVLLAAQDATIEHGLNMPGTSQEGSYVNHEPEYVNTDDEFGIV